MGFPVFPPDEIEVEQFGRDPPEGMLCPQGIISGGTGVVVSHHW